MPAIDLAQLERLVREVIGNSRISLKPEHSASDVPGWDSLNHTVICLELSELLGREVAPMDTSRQPNMAALLAYLNRRS